MNEVEQRVSQIEDMVRDNGADLHTLKTKVKALEARLKMQKTAIEEIICSSWAFLKGLRVQIPPPLRKHLLRSKGRISSIA